MSRSVTFLLCQPFTDFLGFCLWFLVPMSVMYLTVRLNTLFHLLSFNLICVYCKLVNDIQIQQIASICDFK